MSGSSEGQKTAKKGSKIVFLGQPVYLIYQLFARDDFETVTFTIMGNYFHPGGQREYECSFSEIESKYVSLEHHQGLCESGSCSCY